MKNQLLILGAGPAGIATACLMSRKGYQVEVLDASYFPRTKICGEFLNPQAVQWLDREGLLNSLLEIQPYPIHGMRLSDHQGREFIGHYLPAGTTGYAILRKNFDALLVNLARSSGVQILEGYQATKLIIENGDAIGVSGLAPDGTSFEKFAEMIVGADGRNNLIGRTFGWMHTWKHLRKHAYMTYFQPLPDLIDCGEIHLVEHGYIGIAPIDSTLANVALVIDEKYCPAADDDPKEFFLRSIRASHLRFRFDGLQPLSPLITAGPLAYRMKRISGHRTILVGDTCGFIDPFTGEGINYAFLSSDLAAETLEACFKQNRFDDEMLQSYDQKHHAQFRQKKKLSLLLQKALSRTTIADYVIGRFVKNRDSGDRIVSAVGSSIDLSEVFNLRFLFQLIA